MTSTSSPTATATAVLPPATTRFAPLVIENATVATSVRCAPAWGAAGKPVIVVPKLMGTRLPPAAQISGVALAAGAVPLSSSMAPVALPFSAALAATPGAPVTEIFQSDFVSPLPPTAVTAIVSAVPTYEVTVPDMKRVGSEALTAVMKMLAAYCLPAWVASVLLPVPMTRGVVLVPVSTVPVAASWASEAAAWAALRATTAASRAACAATTCSVAALADATALAADSFTSTCFAFTSANRAFSSAPRKGSSAMYLATASSNGTCAID